MSVFITHRPSKMLIITRTSVDSIEQLATST